MLFKQSVVAALMAFASLVLALPAPSVVELSVRDEDDSVEYKRSQMETFVCKRDDKYDEAHFCSTKLSYTCTNSLQQPVLELPPQEERCCGPVQVRQPLGFFTGSV